MDGMTVEQAELRRQEKAKATIVTGFPGPCSFEMELRAIEARIKASQTQHRVTVDHDALKRAEKVHDLLLEMKLPKRHARKAWADLDQTGEWGVKLAMVRTLVGKGFLAALVGIHGNGKTQFGVEVLRDAANKLLTGMFITATDFFMAIKAAYRDKSSDAEKDVIARYCKPQVLVIDEMAKRGETEWENRLIFHLINNRYMDDLDTLLIANQEAEQFEASAGPALVRRMTETGGLIECNWEAFV